MDTKSSHVSTSLTRHTEHSEPLLSIKVYQLRLVNCTHTQLSLDSRNFWRLLEETASESLQDSLKFVLILDVSVETNNTDILLSCSLLRFSQTSCSEYHNSYLSRHTMRQPVTLGSSVPE